MAVSNRNGRATPKTPASQQPAKQAPPPDEIELEPDLGATDAEAVTEATAAIRAAEIEPPTDLASELEGEAPPRPPRPAALTGGPTLDDVKDAEVESQFGFYEEEAITSLALDLPEFFSTMAHLIRPEYFARLETRYVVAWILNLIERYNVVPTRELLKDHLLRQLTTDDPHEDIIKIVERRSNPREVPMVRERLKDWARVRAYGLLYAEDTITAYQKGDLRRLEEIFKQAARINDIGYSGFWFFDQVEELLDPSNVIHLKTGWPSLDRVLNDGGPSPGEVLIWLAATNVGKCHTLESKIIEERLSRVYELEMDDGTVIKLVGAEEVQTARGSVKVCDLSEGDDITALSPVGHARYADVPGMWLRGGSTPELTIEPSPRCPLHQEG